ncbi:hypothetical protein E3P99_03097 [Wallemia hederae]|uniref:Kinetochore protein SPC25 n=1 Tax=Wallemia hederae TaxID=1540922 RepID=A0A4T0FHD1_9BASI|nr:hypothetical protein E3P99_03097 [Wallemia hederae]
MTTPQKKLISRTASLEQPMLDEHRVLKLEGARNCMAALQLALDAHSNDIRERVMKRKAEHAKALNEEKENQNRIKEEMDMLKKKEIEIVKDIQREAQEREEMNGQIQQYQRQIRSLSTTRGGLIAEIEEYRERIAKQKAVVESEQKTLDVQASKNAPELAFCEQMLGLKLRSDKPDFIVLTFSQIDDRQPDRRFSIELDLRDTDYKVASCDPPPHNLDALIRELNSSRGFYTFIKRLRAAFRGVVVEEKRA